MLLKKLFSTGFNKTHLDIAILIARITIGSFMLVHGIPKLGKFFLAEGDLSFADPIGIGETPSLVLTVFSEVICSVLIIIGFGTRLATIPLIITMLVAIFVIHADDGFGKQEMALHYLLVYIILLITGSGKYSFDHLVENKI